MSDADYSPDDFPPVEVEDGPTDAQTFDQRVGKNITLFRGNMSQQDLAHRMRAQGFKWSQATVWATEKGDRPVRLSEVEIGRASCRESVDGSLDGECL